MGWLIGWLMAGTAAAAQPAAFQCASLLASQSRQPAYGPVAGETRCEGFYEKNVSQPFLEVVSLTRSPPGSWAVDSEGRLNLRGLPRVDTRLLIQPMRSNPLYRVDAWLPRGSTLAWRSMPMLRATGLQLRDLGLLAFAGSPAETPVLAPVSTQTGDEGAVAHAVLRPSVAISALSWRSYRPDSPGAPPGVVPGVWKALPGATLFAWERFALAIPLPADGLGLHIDVRALDSQGQGLPLLRFVVLGTQDDKP